MLDNWLDGLTDEHDMTAERVGAIRGNAQAALNENYALGICFSEESDLLSQWRAYSDDATGFSVTFNREMLQRRYARADFLASPALIQIAYGAAHSPQVARADQWLRLAFFDDAADCQIDNNVTQFLEAEFSSDLSQRRRLAAALLFSIKSPAFCEEKEWRILHYSSLNALRNVEFREHKTVISPYVRLPFEREAIIGVTLGPCNDTPEDVVEALLKANGVHAWVRKSAASYVSR